MCTASLLLLTTMQPVFSDIDDVDRQMPRLLVQSASGHLLHERSQPVPQAACEEPCLMSRDIAGDIAHREDAQQAAVVSTHVEDNLEGGPEPNSVVHPLPYAFLLLAGLAEGMLASKYGHLIAGGQPRYNQGDLHPENASRTAQSFTNVLQRLPQWHCV